MIFNSIIIWANEFFQNHLPVLHNNPAMLLLLIAYIGLSLCLYAATEGKEFLISGWAGLLFMLPFVKL